MLNLNPPDSGVLLIVSGPSGAGKSTLLSAAMERVPGLSFSVSATTRSMRAGEVEGEDYHFVSPDRFESLVAQGALLEHATVSTKKLFNSLIGSSIAYQACSPFSERRSKKHSRQRCHNE